jgi:hypothetical protein
MFLFSRSNRVTLRRVAGKSGLFPDAVADHGLCLNTKEDDGK